MSIEVKGLRKEFGTQCAVNSISFSVTAGEIVGFLGPNGAGKSTTMKMLTGYLQPDRGTAFIGGIEVTKDPLNARKKIGYLAEQNALYPDLYVREYLSFIARIQQVKTIDSSVDKIIELTGLQPEAHKTIGKLSKGYKQRVGLAAALVHDPEVLIR